MSALTIVTRQVPTGSGCVTEIKALKGTNFDTVDGWQLRGTLAEGETMLVYGVFYVFPFLRFTYPAWVTNLGATKWSATLWKGRNAKPRDAQAPLEIRTDSVVTRTALI